MNEKTPTQSLLLWFFFAVNRQYRVFWSVCLLFSYRPISSTHRIHIHLYDTMSIFKVRLRIHTHTHTQFELLDRCAITNKRPMQSVTDHALFVTWYKWYEWRHEKECMIKLANLLRGHLFVIHPMQRHYMMVWLYRFTTV